MNEFSDDFTIYNLIRCEFNSDDYHIFNDPRSLPCGNSACLSCIEKVLADGKLYCKLCNQVHNINSIKDLPRLLPIERVIDNHVFRLTKYLISKSKEISNNLTENLETRENELKKVFQNVQKDIKKHIDTMKCQLDELQTKLFETCENLKIKIGSDLSQIEKIASRIHVDKFVKEAQKLLDKNETNLDKLKKNMHLCEYNMKKLKKCQTSFTNAMSSFLFTPNLNWIPKVDDVGKVGELVDTEKDMQELEDILDKEEDGKIRLKFKNKNEINEICLKFKPYAVCELKNGDLAVTAFDKHKLIVIKSDNFEHIKEITGAENIPLRYPSGLCSDDQKENIYLCDQYNHRVIVFDSTVDSLINVIKEDFINPIDVSFNSNHLYVLDYGNKLIKCFERDGRLTSQYILHDLHNDILNGPRHQAISNDQIAVTDNFDKIYIYDKLTNQIVQVIDADLDTRFMSVYYLDDYLVLHEIKTKDEKTVANNFVCFERFERLDSSDKIIRFNWKETFQREIDLLKDSVARSYNIAKIGDKFAICLHEKKKIVLI